MIGAQIGLSRASIQKHAAMAVFLGSINIQKAFGCTNMGLPLVPTGEKSDKNSRTFLFIDIYEYAALIDECLRDSGSFIELGFEESPELIERFVKPHKLSILHEYIFALICVEEVRKFRKHSELFEKEDIERFEKTFEEYGVLILCHMSHSTQTRIPLRMR